MTFTANIDELKQSLDSYLARVRAGDELLIQIDARTVARLVPASESKNLPFGCGATTNKIVGPVDEPLIPESDWHMLTGESFP